MGVTAFLILQSIESGRVVSSGTGRGEGEGGWTTGLLCSADTLLLLLTESVETCREMYSESVYIIIALE